MPRPYTDNQKLSCCSPMLAALIALDVGRWKKNARMICSANLDSLDVLLVRSLSAKYRRDRYRRDKSVKFGTELP